MSVLGIDDNTAVNRPEKRFIFETKLTYEFQIAWISGVRGRPLIIWGGRGFSQTKFFFFGDPPNQIFIFFAKIDEVIFFFK